MGIITKGEYKTSPPILTVDGQYQNLIVDENGNLKVTTGSTYRESNNYVAGALSTTGRIGTVAAGATIIVAMSCDDFPVTKVDWAIDCDKSWSYQLGRANNNPLTATITLTDATAVDDGDTFVLNGLTFTAESTEGDALAANRKYYIPSQALAAANLAALLLDETYGVPGLATAAVTAPGSTDVITLACDDATVLQFGQGTSAANEIAWAETSKLNIDMQSALITGKTTTAAWAAEVIPDHYIDGWGWACILLTNNDGANAATFEVRGTRY